MGKPTIAIGTDRKMYDALVYLVYQLTALIGSGRHDGVTVDDVRNHHRAGDLLPWLNSLDSRFDVSVFGDRGIWVLELREWLDGLDRGFNAYCADDFGTERWGLCYMLVLSVEQLRAELRQLMESYDARLAEAARAAPAEQPGHQRSIEPFASHRSHARRSRPGGNRSQIARRNDYEVTSCWNSRNSKARMPTVISPVSVRKSSLALRGCKIPCFAAG